MPPDPPDNLSSALTRNIRTLEERRAREAVGTTRQEKVVVAITSFMGSMPFVYLHAAFYGAWVLAAFGMLPSIPKFDPSFAGLATTASIEAIFLSTFVLISQNRMAEAADKRADLDLHISLLTEHELTKLTEMVEAVAAHFDITTANHPELSEIKKDVALETVLDEIEAQQRFCQGSRLQV
jgi:uncharacterized membrane protein